MKHFTFFKTIAFIGLAFLATETVAQKRVELNRIGGYATGIFDEGAAEIMAYDKTGEKLFFVNANDATVEILDLSNPVNPTLISSIDCTAYGATANSIAVGTNFIAVAIEATVKQDPGKVVFFDLDGVYISDVTVGALPDMVTLTPDENYALVANEGEPDDDYLVDPEGTVSLIDLTGSVAALTQAQVTSINFNSFDGTTFTDGTRIFGNNGTATVSQDLEPEYIAVNASSTKAYVSCQENNCIITIDITTATATDITGLGYKNHNLPGNGIDASNEAEAINIANYPVYGMYQPDAMVAKEINGQVYLFTANEGDSRDYDGYSEEDRVKDLVLDPTVFPNATQLQEDTLLGRLKITTSQGDIDNDGDFDELYVYGARSFSIWDASNLSQVYDSKDEFEQNIAVLDPEHFNSTNDDNTSYKNRSDDKGCEPEAIAVGEINGKHYAFVGLERHGGIMVYDVTNPTSSQFIQFINYRNFEVDATSPDAGDLGPECIIFIPRTDNKYGRDLLLVSKEVSGSISVYEINVNLTVEPEDETELTQYDFLNSQVIGSYEDMTFYEGGISGLHHIKDSEDEFYLITDRGVNAVANDNALANGPTKFFPFPDYSPKIFKVRAVANNLNILSTMEITTPNGQLATGIPLPENAGWTGEATWSDLQGTEIDADIWGMDPEGIVEGPFGNLWICEEYGAAILNIDKTTGEIIKRYTPFATQTEDVAIDTTFGLRRANRGFEGIAVAPNGKIYSILQSPVYNPDNTVGQNSRLHRILEIDPFTGTQQIFIYEHDAPKGEIRNADWKIGDLVAVNSNEFLVIEHAERNGWNAKNIYKFNIENATPLTAEDFGGLSLEALADAQTASSFGVITVEKEPFIDLLELGWNRSHDKPEGLTIIDANTIAVINDNDYGIDSPNDDGVIVQTGKTTQLYKYSLPSDLALNLETFTVSVENELSTNSTFEIYPNPATGEEVFFTQAISGQVFNINGMFIASIEKDKSLNINNLAKGVYLLQTDFGTTKKFIVK